MAGLTHILNIHVAQTNLQKILETNQIWHIFDHVELCAMYEKVPLFKLVHVVVTGHIFSLAEKIRQSAMAHSFVRGVVIVHGCWSQ